MATYDFTVRAEDETGAFADRTFSIEVKNDLVERFVAVDNNHAYSSTDGVNWTTRIGQGGHIVKRVGNYWIVGNINTYSSILGNQIRLSSDAVNWTQRTLPSSHTSANSFHFINGWYYFLGTAATTLHNTIWKTQDFIDYSVVYESPFAGAGKVADNIRTFPANMLYSNSEFIFFDRPYNGAPSGQVIDVSQSAIVRFNINTEDNIRHSVSQFILPSGSTGITNFLISFSIHKVNDAFVIYGTDNTRIWDNTIPHYTFDFINYNISNNNFASEGSLVNKTDYLYHNGNVIIGHSGASFHKTKDLQNYSKLYSNAVVFYPRDILSYKGYIYTIPDTSVANHFITGKLYKGTIEDYENGTLQNVSENDPILAPTNLNSVAVIK